MDDHFPYEVFLCHSSKDKPVVLIKSKDTGPIFDVDNLMRVYAYDQNLWTSTIEADVKSLGDRISGTWGSKDSAVSYMQILTTSPQGKT